MAFADGDNDSKLCLKYRKYVRESKLFEKVNESLFPVGCFETSMTNFLWQNRMEFIPPGFFFSPSDSMLIDILHLKNHERPMYRVVIPDMEFYDMHPAQLMDYQPLGSECWYLFARLKKKANGNRPSRGVGQLGHWKASTAAELIKGEKGRNGVEKEGTVLNLVFYEGNERPGTKTNWLMKEYRLVENFVDEWVICRIRHNSVIQGGGSQAGGSRIDGKGGPHIGGGFQAGRSQTEGKGGPHIGGGSQAGQSQTEGKDGPHIGGGSQAGRSQTEGKGGPHIGGGSQAGQSQTEGKDGSHIGGGSQAGRFQTEGKDGSQIDGEVGEYWPRLSMILAKAVNDS